MALSSPIYFNNQLGVLKYIVGRRCVKHTGKPDRLKPLPSYSIFMSPVPIHSWMLEILFLTLEVL